MRLVFSQGADHDQQATFYARAGSNAVRCEAGVAQAQSYPAKPIRFVVPFPAGGSTDVGARLIAEHLSRAFGQQVYVENKSGANGTIGVEDAAKSAPDGYTVLVTIDTVASNPHVFHTNIDPSKDLFADYPGFPSTHRAGGSPLARRKFARRIDRAGEETAGPSIRDRQRTRIASAHGCAVVRADCGHQT